MTIPWNPTYVLFRDETQAMVYREIFLGPMLLFELPAQETTSDFWGVTVSGTPFRKVALSPEDNTKHA